MSPSPEAIAVAADINALSPPDKLRLAAKLLEAKMPEVAYSIISTVKTELGAALMLHKVGQ